MSKDPLLKLKPFVEEKKLFVNFTAVEPAKLRAFLLSNEPKVMYEKVKIRYVDCMDNEDNEGKQFIGAHHTNLRDLSKAQASLNALVQDAQTWQLLNSADVVVFYCSRAQGRSPAMMQKYQQARQATAPNARTANYNEKQEILLLSTGMAGYLALAQQGSDSPYVVPWSLFD